MSAVLEAKPVETQALELVDTVKAITVTTDAEYEVAAGWLRECAATKKRITEFFKPIVKAAHEAHKAAKDRENEALKPVVEAESHLSRTMGDYQAACAAERREQERMLREIERQEQEAETQRIAAQYAAMGNDALADAAMNAPLPASTIKLDEFAPKVAGTATLTTWTFEIVDAALIPREYLIPDEKKIGGVVRAMKDATKIPGVRIIKQTKVHARV
jgi:hypothetical protein